MYHAQVKPPRPEPQEFTEEAEEEFPSVAKVVTNFSVLWEPHCGHSTLLLCENGTKSSKFA